MVLDDGVVLCHGLLCCVYLDSHSAAPRLFPQDVTRWKALSQMILEDGLFDATSALVIQSLRDPAERNQADLRRHRKRILHALPVMDRDAAGFESEGFHIGQVCFAGGLNFFDMRKPLARVELEPADAAFDWRLPHACRVVRAGVRAAVASTASLAPRNPPAECAKDVNGAAAGRKEEP